MNPLDPKEVEAEMRPIVRRIARALSRRVPSHMLEREDLESIGMLGVMAAINTYDPSIGVPPRPYFIRRAHGEMIDEVRRLDPVPHPTRSLLRRSDRVSERLSKLLTKKAASAGSASELGVTADHLVKVRERAASMIRPRHIDERVAGDEHDPLSLGDTVSDGVEPHDELYPDDDSAGLRRRLLVDLSPIELEAALLINVDGLSVSQAAALLDLPLMEAIAIVGRVEFKLGARDAAGGLIPITPKRKSTP